MKQIEIFKAGKRPDASGQMIEIKLNDLVQAVTAYNPDLHEAPAVIGHPKDNAPAYAWVKGLNIEGDTLKAELTQIDPNFAEMVEAGRFKKVSASFYLADSPHNPKPGYLYLRHVGFLGAMPPAVKGLRNPEFSDNEDGVVNFAVNLEEDEITALRAEIARLKAESVQKDTLEFTEGLIKAGRLAPIAREKAVEILNYAEECDQAGVINFNEGESLAQKVREFLSLQPQIIQFSEIATKENAPSGQANDWAEYSEHTPAEMIMLDQRIRQCMRENHVDYKTAFDLIHK
ncbi:peptidase [Pasteurella caecimuris]|uniref:peptidase n=1 Tax=Rodentibacter caecimuris TaxID=1796644 RepID=UPI0021501D8C|nr:peptidase [Pasteurella caecimuris]MCR1837667.1 peptidase [Pasteurella caecimuris]MCU0106649.1 peptidase [Pasteurella caecimuris]